MKGGDVDIHIYYEKKKPNSLVLKIGQRETQKRLFLNQKKKRKKIKSCFYLARSFAVSPLQLFFQLSRWCHLSLFYLSHPVCQIPKKR